MPKKNLPVLTTNDTLKYVYQERTSEPCHPSVWKWLMLLLGAKFQIGQAEDAFAIEHFVRFERALDRWSSSLVLRWSRWMVLGMEPTTLTFRKH